MMSADAYTKSGKLILTDWQTPSWLFEHFDTRYGGFTVDAAASKQNRMCRRFWDQDMDGLSQSWDGERVWCNPPYGKDIDKWLRKADTSNGTATVLVPVRSEMRWWHEYIFRIQEITFIEGRVHFFRPDNPKGSRPVWSSAVFYFGLHRPSNPIIRSIRTPWVEKHRPI